MTGGRIRLYEKTRKLRGAKMPAFLLSFVFVTILSSGIFARPTQAEFLDSLTNTVTCVLNLDCVPPKDNTGTPSDTTPPTGGGDTGTGNPSDPGTTTDPGSGGTTQPPADDGVDPGVAVDASPHLAGGGVETVHITGTASDQNLDSYTLAINGTVAKQETALTETNISVNFDWSVSTPDRIPSGTYLITLDATDKSGRKGHSEIQVEVDNDGPDLTVTGGNVIIKSGTISPGVDASDPHEPITYQWTADSDNPAVLDYDATAAEPIFSPTVEGHYTFYLSTFDGLGNVSKATFTFDYAKELPTVPLPVTDDPTDKLTNNAPATPTIVPSSTSPASRSGRDEVPTSDESKVLGSSTTVPDQTPPAKMKTSITPTEKGWSIFGVMWYWWIVIVGLLVSAFQIIKKTIVTRIPEQS